MSLRSSPRRSPQHRPEVANIITSSTQSNHSLEDADNDGPSHAGDTNASSTSSLHQSSFKHKYSSTPRRSPQLQKRLFNSHHVHRQPYSIPKLVLSTLLLIGLVSLLSMRKETSQIRNIRRADEQANAVQKKVHSSRSVVETAVHTPSNDSSDANVGCYQHQNSTKDPFENNPHHKLTQHHHQNNTERQMQLQTTQPNPFALSPGELPGYTGWARPEQTLAGYFEITASSHFASQRYHAIVKSGEKFSLLITCNNEEGGTYICPEDGGTLFYVRAYGPSVITGDLTDHHNTSYSIEMYPVDPGEYTVEAVVTFSAPLEYSEFPINWNAGEETGAEEQRSQTDTTEEEPGYEGYLVYGFPLLIRVDPDESRSTSTSKQLCSKSQLTESSPQSSLSKGYWQVIDHVARSSHRPLTPDETGVSLDGYRMGLNSVGVRMHYLYAECELIHIRDIVGDASKGNGQLNQCLSTLGYVDNVVTEASGNHSYAGIVRFANDTINQTTSNIDADFNGIQVIFIGDSVMKLEMGFFQKLVGGSNTNGVNVTFIETNGGIHATLPNIASTLNEIQTRDKKRLSKKVILFNSGLHDIDILCCAKRSRTRNSTDALGKAESCVDAYRDIMTQFVQLIDTYRADLKVFRSTTAGWHKYGNHGFTWPASEMQPMSRSPHLAHHFNTIAYDIIQQQSSSILVIDGYWTTLARPDHTQTSDQNQVGKHLVHPGYEVLSVFARRWLMLILWGLCGQVLRG